MNTPSINATPRISAGTATDATTFTGAGTAAVALRAGPEIGARLVRLEIGASDPQALAAFHASTFRLRTRVEGDTHVCHAPQRELAFVSGGAGHLRRASFRFTERAAFDAHRTRVLAAGVPLVEDEPFENDPQSVASTDTRAAFETFAPVDTLAARHTVRDPHGHLFTFLFDSRVARDEGVRVPASESARLQHFALRTPSPAPLAQFFVDTLGFVVSDRVLDTKGELGAVFLRTDFEHHALALFRSPEQRFDHFSCEVPGWLELRDWADHMASVGVDLAWGVGRHGPGNDTFFMVRDADGNMGEISAELEVCEPGRPVGTWPHRPQTLNRWGVAIMRE